MSLQNNIKLLKTVWELLPVYDFGFRGDKYIMEKVRVVYLAHDMPTGPLLYTYQILSKYSMRLSKLWSTQGCFYVRNPTTKTKSEKGHNLAKISRTVTNIEFDLYFTMIYPSANF